MAAAAFPARPFGSLSSRISAAGANPILHIGRRHLFPSVDSAGFWMRHGLIPLGQCRIRVRKRSKDYENAVLSGRLLSGFPRAGFEFGRRIGGRHCAPPRAAAASGGSFDSFDHKVAEAVKNSGLKNLLIEILKIVEFRRLRRIQWVPRLVAATVVVILAGFLARRSAVGGAFVAARFGILGLAIFFLLPPLVDTEKRQLIFEKLQPSYAKASEQLQIFSRAILQVAHDSHRTIASVLSSSGLFLVEKCGRNTEQSMSPSGGSLMSEAQGGINAPNKIKKSRSEDVVWDCNPDAETVVTSISQSVAILMSIITAAELAAVDVDSLSGVKLGIQDLCRELQSVEAVLLAKQSLLHSKVNNIVVETPSSDRTSKDLQTNFGGSESSEGLMAPKLVDYGESDHREKENIPDCDNSKSDESRQHQGKQQPLAFKFIPVDEANNSSPPLLQVTSSSPAQLEFKFSPLVSRTGYIPAIAGCNGDTAQAADGPMVMERLPPEDLKRTMAETVSGLGKSSSAGVDDHLVQSQKLSPFSTSLVDEQSPPLNHSSPNKHKQVEVVERITSSSPDPWLSNCSPEPIEQKTIAGGDWAARSRNEWRNEDDGQLLDLVLVVDENLKAEAPHRDGIGNGKACNSYGSVDFWGKNAGSISKTSEQRGTLTKRKATGRGSSFGSADDWDDNWPQDRGKRLAKEEEQRPLLRRDLPSSSIAAQPWDGEQQPGASGRGAVRDDYQLWREDASAAADADDYGRGGANIRGPQILSRDRALDGSKERPMDEKVSRTRDTAEDPRSVGSRFSPQKRTSTSASSSVPSKSREIKESSAMQTIDEASRDVNERNYGGSDRTWNAPLNPDGKVYREPQVDPQIRKSAPNSSTYTPSQLAVTERSLALQQSKQSQTLEFNRCLDQAAALLEEGMQGLEGRIEVGVAERMLYEAAKLLESASEMDPANLTAVGQWGNTLLVHGELKLRVSQQLRSMLPLPNASSPLPRWGGAAADCEREAMELTLQEVCEESEELLVDAGRKYRKALGIDRRDVRALYNWGLALCYRGQLIAEEGGERATQDADKVYLAAIDKFEAMLGISQDYAAGGTAALLNWGLAMRDRSRLRAMGDKERVQLLLQANELFQDAVRLDPNYGQARGAVAACSAELRELQGYEGN